MRTDRRQGDGHHLVAHRRWHEVWRHQLIVSPFREEFFAVLPGGPDRAQSIDVFADPGRGRGSWHTETALVMRTNLWSETKNKSSPRRVLDIPRGVRHHHGTARKS